MSTAKRSSRRQTEASTASPPPASKRQKTTATAHVPVKTGLGFLVDDNARAGTKLDARLTNGVSSSRANRVDESHALVVPDTKDEQDGGSKVNGTRHEIIDISSAEDESSALEESDEEDVKPAILNGHAAALDEGEDAKLGAEDERMEDVQDSGQAANGGSVEEPSFGDMLRAHYPEPVNVHASLPEADRGQSALVPANGSRTLTIPSATSLGTVLTQALKTNDKDLLESCFQVTDLPSVRSTIERLQSQYAATLLQRLAERIHKSPGRTGSLMIWIQWALVTHGGYIASQPDVMRRLKSLAQVVRERASGLQALLHLKGKLDLLSAQLEHRKNMQARSRAANADDGDDEEAILYVEGQDDDLSEDEDVAMHDNTGSRLLQPPALKLKGQTATPRSEAEPSEDDESEDDMPNGVAQEANDESEGDDAEEQEEGLFDDEAEETSGDEGEEASSDDEEADSAPDSSNEGESSSDESDAGVKQPRPKTLDRKR